MLEKLCGNKKKFIASSLVAVGVLLHGTLGITALANAESNTNITVSLQASRPLITGNIRGTSTVISNNATNQSIRTRVVIDAGGAVTTGNWFQRTPNSGNLERYAYISSHQVIGSGRSGTAVGTGARRASANGAWTNLSTSRSF